MAGRRSLRAPSDYFGDGGVWLFSDEYDLLWPTLASMAASAVVGSIASVVNPLLNADKRFAASCAMAMLVLGMCMVWEYLGDWDVKPFRFLVWVPPALSLGRMAMTIPAHVRSGAEQAVVLLNQFPEPAKNALIIGAAVVSFVAACVKLVKNLAA